MITGPDISSHQHDAGVPLDFHAVKAAGHSFVIVKATEGSSYTNPYFAGDVHDAHAAGLVTWPYVWVSPSNGVAQGRHALAVIEPVFVRGSLVWLDYEQEGVSHDTLHALRIELEGAGYRTGTYTFPDFWHRVGAPDCTDCGSRPLWWADYNPSHDRPAPPPWGHVSLRQTHGTSYAVPGISGLQDMSRAAEMCIELAQLWSSETGGAPAARRADEPKAPADTESPVDWTG